MFNIALELKRIGAVLLDVFPKAPHEEIACEGFTLSFDRFHVCGYIDVAINCPREENTWTRFPGKTSFYETSLKADENRKCLGLFYPTKPPHQSLKLRLKTKTSISFTLKRKALRKLSLNSQRFYRNGSNDFIRKELNSFERWCKENLRVFQGAFECT